MYAHQAATKKVVTAHGRRAVSRIHFRPLLSDPNAVDLWGTKWQQQQQHQQHLSLHTWASGGGVFPDHERRRDKDEREQQRCLRMMQQPSSSLGYHTTTHTDRAAVPLILGFGALAAVSYAGAQGVKAYNEWKNSQPTAEEEQAAAAAAAKEQAAKDKATAENTTTYTKEESNEDSDAAAADKRNKQQQEQADRSKRGNVFKEWFGVGVGSKYYEGGFEETMTRREAALILGVRESSSAARIKEAHRKLLILNHPDTGGSTYIAGKINEAKELLIKGKS